MIQTAVTWLADQVGLDTTLVLARLLTRMSGSRLRQRLPNVSFQVSASAPEVAIPVRPVRTPTAKDTLAAIRASAVDRFKYVRAAAGPRGRVDTWRLGLRRSTGGILSLMCCHAATPA